MEAQVKVTEKEGWVRVLDIEVAAEEVNKTFAQVTDKYKQQAEIPGFRPGKAPVEMVAARYRQAIRQDALEQLLPNAYEHAVKENKLFPLGDPSIDNVVFEKGKPFTLTVEITIRPEVEIANYKGFKLKRQVWEITDEDVDRQIDRFREVKAEHIDVTRAVEKGDIVVCDLQKVHDKNNRVKETKFDDRVIDLVEERCAPELLQHLPGMKIGEGKDIEIVYPADHPEPNFAGNTVLYRTWVKSIREKKLPVVNDEFAASLGPYKDLNDLKEKVRADMELNVKQESDKDLREQVRKAAVEANNFEVPPTLVEEYLTSLTRRFQGMGGEIDEQKIREQFRPLAEEQFRWDFIMHEVAHKEKLDLSEAESAAIRKFVQDSNAQPNADKREPLSEEKLSTDILEQKVFDFLIENAETEDVPRVLSSKIIKP